MTEKQYYCDDGLSRRDYAIFDLSKSDKSFRDFEDEDGFVESWKFDCYLCDETDSLMTGEEVCRLLNELKDENRFLKQQLKEYSGMKGDLIRTNSRLIRRLAEFNIKYEDILGE